MSSHPATARSRRQATSGASQPHHLSRTLNSNSYSDYAGWVDGIANLTDQHAATALVSNDFARNHVNQSKNVTEVETNNLQNGETSAKEVAGGALERDQSMHLEASMRQTIDALERELNRVGEIVAELGTPDGFGPTGLTNAQMEQMLEMINSRSASDWNADCTVVRRRTVPSTIIDMPPMACADVCIRRRCGVQPPLEVRVAIVGNVDSGKSTMVGVLTRGLLDDGRGLARSKVFKHGHEGETGRTSSIGQHNLCLDATGRVLNDPAFRAATTAEYVSRASKVLTLVDLAGHEKYFKTTAYGLTGHLPDYACLIVGANAGVVGMCKEHLGVALALRVPVFFVVTKIDLAPAHVLQHTLTTLQTILKKPGVKKKPFVVRSTDDVVTCARHMHADSLAPIFLTSAVTGEGLNLVKLFYNLLPQRFDWSERASGPAEFVIDETFSVPGVGTVVAGTVKRGFITGGAQLLLGPDIGDGTFKPCQVKSIHYKRLPVGRVVAGQTAALALKKVKRAQVRKGMVLVSEALKPHASWEFDADIAILTHSTTIQPRYQAVIHCEIVRQSARVVAMNCDRLRSGDRAYVRFRFMQHPEYLTVGSRFVFREGRTKGIGVVVGTEAEPLQSTAAA